MIKRNILTGIVLALSLLGSFSASAADSDVSIFGIGLFPPVQLPDSGYGIAGLRVSVVGKSREVAGIDVGLLGNMTEKNFAGIAISGLFNYNPALSTIVGLQVAGLANLNTGSSKVYGVQIAAYNKTTSVYGLQLGLVNVTNDLHGIQIGLFNINKNGPFKASPILNIGF